MDYGRNFKYFKPGSNKGAIALIVIGFIFLFIGSGWSVLGLLMMIGGIALIVLKAKGKVTDQEYEQSIANELNGIVPKALNKLGLDEDEVKQIDPIVIGNYNYDNAVSVTSGATLTENMTLLKVGKDGVARSNKYAAIVIFASDDAVHYYRYDFTTTTPQQSELTGEYFYTDIVNLSTSQETRNVNGVSIQSEYLTLRSSGGTGFQIALDGNDDKTLRSVNALRSLYKEKKRG